MRYRQWWMILIGCVALLLLPFAPAWCDEEQVGDEATRALMGKSYELWNPREGEGLPASEALRRARAFGRSHEEWTHPHYWAAWVLWGLPE